MKDLQVFEDRIDKFGSGAPAPAIEKLDLHPGPERLDHRVVVAHLVNRTEFNRFVWKPTLVKAGIPTTRENGFRMLRHHFAAVLLERGMSIKAVADFLEHADPGFALRTYTRRRPSSEERMRQVIEDVWATGQSALDVP